MIRKAFKKWKKKVTKTKPKNPTTNDDNMDKKLSDNVCTIQPSSEQENPDSFVQQTRSGNHHFNMINIPSNEVPTHPQILEASTKNAILTYSRENEN